MKFDVRNKKVTVIGFSRSGYSAAKLLQRVGAKARVSELRDDPELRARLQELKVREEQLGVHTRDFITQSDLIVTSPGVPPDANPLVWAAQEKIPVISEIELGYMFCSAPIVAVTGTNGKSTTVSLIHDIFLKNGLQSLLLGNIGRPFTERVLDLPADAVVVLEISSFQLERVSRFRPTVAVFLNLTQDHLDRYPDLDAYRDAKFRIFENQKHTDYAVLNYDDSDMRARSRRIRAQVFFFSTRQKTQGAFLQEETLYTNIGEKAERLCDVSEMRLKGIHNIKNTLAASLAAKLMARTIDMRSSVKGFVGLRHRFETVAEIEGVTYINDSKSTTVDSALNALEAFSPGKVILIAGGRDKGSDFSPLKNRLNKVKHLILLGEARKKIRAALHGCDTPIAEAATMEEAVLTAKTIASRGETILLSPMCASFDMYKDYAQRGEDFCNAVTANKKNILQNTV